MRLQNIYSGNYFRLVIFPLLLVVVALLFIPSIPSGVDLKGGTLITLQLKNAISEEELKDIINNLGIKSYTVKIYQNPQGWVSEIEMTTDEKIIKAEDKLILLDKLNEEIDEIEATLARLRAQYQTEQTTDLSNQIQNKNNELNAKINDFIKTAKEITELSKSISGSGTNFDLSTQIENDTVKEREIKHIKSEVNLIYMDAKRIWREKIINNIKDKIDVESYSLEEVSPTLSTYFINKVIIMALVSLFLIIIVIFLIFRNLLPSLIVMSGASADIIISLGAMGLFGIPMTLASFTALMMMVGLSLDTDMMLTIKVLKRTEGTPRERAYDAFKTGFAMTTTTLAAFFALLLLGIITRIPVYYEIGAIGFFGLIGDLIATWCLNAVIVLWYVERRSLK